MSPSIVAALAAALIGIGVWFAVAGFQPQYESPSKPHTSRRTKLSRSVAIKIVVGIAIGIVLAIVTGWILLIVLAPIAIIGIPWLFAEGGGKKEIEKLDGLEEWTRVLSGVLSAGLSLDQAIAATQSSTPQVLKEPVDVLISRLRSRMSTEEALRLFAEELDDTTADKIALVLILGAKRPDVPLAPVLTQLAQSVAADVAGRRAVQAERVKQDSVVRYVVLITLVVFGGFLVFGGQYVAPYGTALGQPVLLLLLAAYVGVIVWLRKMNAAPPLPRLLGTSAKGTVS